MQDWKDMTKLEKTAALNTYLMVENVKIAFGNDAIFCRNIRSRFIETQNESYRDFLILYLLDKKFTIRDGFKFFDAGSLLLSDTDVYSLMAEKLDIAFDQVLGIYLLSLNLDSRTNNNFFFDEINTIKNEVSKLSEDLRTRMSIFVEVHDLEYQKKNPEKYIELLNAPLTSLLSIKLSNNEKVNRAIKERMVKAKK